MLAMQMVHLYHLFLGREISQNQSSLKDLKSKKKHVQEMSSKNVTCLFGKYLTADFCCKNAKKL